MGLMCGGIPPPGRCVQLKLDRVWVQGVSAERQMLGRPARYVPGLRLQLAPLLRYYREVWYLANAVHMPRGVMRPGEHREAYQLAVDTRFRPQRNSTTRRPARRSPLHAVVEAAEVCHEAMPTLLSP